VDVPLPVKEDSPLDPAAVRKRLQTVLERAEYNRLHFHGLRHTFATTALQNGVHVRTVSSMPGHYDTGFALRTYPHTAKQKQDEAAQTMGAFMEQVM
jgi:site-specific recombinase XerD